MTGRKVAGLAVAVAAVAAACLSGQSATAERPGVPHRHAEAFVTVQACSEFCTYDSSWGGRVRSGSNG